MELALDEARASEDIRKRSDAFVAGFEELVERLAPEIDDQTLHDLLQRYTPSGKPN
jgi:hypothetical protein